MFNPKTLLPSLLPCVYAAFTLFPTAAAQAAPLDQDIAALAGQWQGEAHDGTKVTVVVTPGRGDMLATGSLKVEGGQQPGEIDFNWIRLEKLDFMVPSKTPFDADKQEAYTMSRLPQGGFKFVRLAHPDGDPASLQSEELEIGRVTHAGTRTLKIIRGEKLCRDDSAPAAGAVGKVCGDASVEQVTLRKAAAPANP
jgi:hypothetical protein